MLPHIDVGEIPAGDVRQHDADLVTEIPLGAQRARLAGQPALERFLDRVTRCSANSMIVEPVARAALELERIRPGPKSAANPTPKVLHAGFPAFAVASNGHAGERRASR
jgi:hypothetical protein